VQNNVKNLHLSAWLILRLGNLKVEKKLGGESNQKKKVAEIQAGRQLADSQWHYLNEIFNGL